MRRTTQAVILARGLGTRMRRSAEAPAGVMLSPDEARAADTGIKGMIPFARPFLDYLLSALADAGITRVTIVVGPEHNVVREYFDATREGRRVAVEFAEQRAARGTADAVLAARGTVTERGGKSGAPGSSHSDSFLVLNADNYYFPREISALASLGANGLVAYEASALVEGSGIEQERVRQFALLDIGADDVLHEIHEKPSAHDPLANLPERWVSMNLWSFTPAIFDSCEAVRPSVRGELELQSAVMHSMRERGATFTVVRARAAVLDLSSRADVARVGAQLSNVDPRP